MSDTRDYFLTRQLPFYQYFDVLNAPHDYVQLLAVAHLSVEEYTLRDRIEHWTDSTVPFLFRVTGAADLEEAKGLLAMCIGLIDTKNLLRGGELERLVIDACFLLSEEAEHDITREEFDAWRDRWLKSVQQYLETKEEQQ